jgi:hypothetical protein
LDLDQVGPPQLNSLLHRTDKRRGAHEKRRRRAGRALFWITKNGGLSHFFLLTGDREPEPKMVAVVSSLSRSTTEVAVAPLCLGRVLRRCQMPLQRLMPMDLATVMGCRSPVDACQPDTSTRKWPPPPQHRPSSGHRPTVTKCYTAPSNSSASKGKILSDWRCASCVG